MTLVTEFFAPLATATANGRGMPDLPRVVVPHPYDTLPDDAIVRHARNYLSDVVDKLLVESKL